MTSRTRNLIGVRFFALTAVLLAVMAITGLGEVSAEATHGLTQTISPESLDLRG